MAEKTYKYAYEKLMDENKLSINELPEDARTGISAIKDQEKGIALQDKKGKKPSAATLNKIKAWDKAVTREIVDFLEDRNEDAVEKEKLANAGKEEAKKISEESAAAKLEEDEAAKNKAPEVDPRGAEIDAECIKMVSNSKDKVDLNYLKEHAPTAYKLIFDTYEKQGENGISTSNFSILEINDQRETFQLKKL